MREGNSLAPFEKSIVTLLKMFQRINNADVNEQAQDVQKVPMGDFVSLCTVNIAWTKYEHLF